MTTTTSTQTTTDPTRSPAGARRTALLTGGSRGLGRAILGDLVAAGWRVVTDGRDDLALAAAMADLGDAAEQVTALPGDVTDPEHRRALVATATRSGTLDLLVLNASELGPSPLPRVADLSADDLRRVLEVNVVASAALLRLALPALRSAGGQVLSISSDAAVEPYPTWGAYAASKAALDHLVAILAQEEPEVRAHVLDPGDLRTEMHQRAFPGEDISDRPEPAAVLPALRRLVDGDLPSGRLRAADLLTEVAR